MERRVFYEQVKQHFRYLIEGCGFSLIHEEYHPEAYGNSMVVLEGHDCRVRVLLERDQVFVDIGPIWAPEVWSTTASDLWFDLGTITAYLTGGADSWEYQLPDTSLDRAARVDQQLVRLAGRFRPYVESACRLMRKDAFERSRAELVSFRERRAREKWGDLLRG